MNTSITTSRFASALDAINFVSELKKADDKRDSVRASVRGLIDGNPPFSAKALKDAGQSYRTNINFREAESVVNVAASSFYDLFSEAPTLSVITPTAGDKRKRVEWGNTMTEKYAELEKADCGHDYRIQKSQGEMVVMGTGPVFWDNPMDWRPKAVNSSDVMVPDGTEADISAFEVCGIKRDYTLSELYMYINDEEAAEKVGWKVSAVKESIKAAAPKNPSGASTTWEEAQNNLRNNDISYSSRGEKVCTVHLLYKERKTGKVSRVVIDPKNDKDFLFKKEGEYENWKQAGVMFYYDRGNGTHHSVKGLGIKMYGIMELKNRFKCQLADSGLMRAQILIQPSDSATQQSMQIIPKGPYALLPPGANYIQQNLAGSLDAPLAIDRDLENVISSNLSQYRQRIDKPTGNPRTATEIEAVMAQQSTLGKTQLSRYYAQLDDYAAEKYRRVVKTPYVESEEEYVRLAMDYVKACKDAGVPEDVVRSAKARATRVVGQGNPYLRSQVLTELLSGSGMLPESGRANLISDWVAAKVGQNMVERYNPQDISGYEQNHFWAASVENGMFKDGMAPPVTGSQNHLVHAQVHIKDGADAHASLKENPDGIVEVAAYLQVVLPHISQHLQKLSADPTRKADLALLTQQFNQLVEIADIITRKAQKQAAQAQGQQAPVVPSIEDQIKIEAMQRDQARKDAALQADIERKNKKAQHSNALADAKTASSIANKSLVQQSK